MAAMVTGPLFGVCCGSWERLQRYVIPPAAGNPVLALSGQTSIADAYNIIMEAAKGYDYLILQHDDLEITDTLVFEKIEEAFQEPDIALVGVAGGSAANGLAWWNTEPIGHQRINSGTLDFGKRTGDVDLLEGSFLALPTWALEELAFDSRPGFHGYDEISMKAKGLGLRAVVVDIDTFHHTDLGFDSTESHQDWLKADQWFREKWGI